MRPAHVDFGICDGSESFMETYGGEVMDAKGITITIPMRGTGLLPLNSQ